MSKKDYGMAAGGTVGVGLTISRMINGQVVTMRDKKPDARMDMIAAQEIEKLRKKLADAEVSLAKAMAKAEAVSQRSGHRLVITSGIHQTREMIALYKRTIAKWETGA